jgi:hypothetical protein
MRLRSKRPRKENKNRKETDNMRGQENNRQGVWNEMSFRRYSNRKNEYENDIWEQEEYEVLSYGLLEDITLCNCYGIEDWWEIVEEYN